MAVQEKPLYYLTIHEARKLIQSRALSPVELTRAVLKRIEAVDGRLHAYLNLAEILRSDYRGPLHGIPVAVKDQLDVQGAPALIREKRPPESEDSTVVDKFRKAGAVLLGKLAMSSLPIEIPQPCNPWDTERITGGSSTGAGAAVAAGLCMGAIGEDTAGSIRNPASLCGIVGLKPTYGRISRHGLAPLSWSLDHCGPMTWVVEDAAHVLQTVAGYDPKDPTSIDAPVPDYSAALRQDIKGMVIGVPRHFIEECRSRTDAEITTSVDKAIGELQRLGARIEEVALPILKLATIANAVIYYNEHYAAHIGDTKTVIRNAATARRARIYLGLLTSAADYIQAQRIRSRIKRECAEVFRKVDLLALPCQLGPAPTFKEVDPLDTLYKHLGPEYHAPFNLAGLPAISIPCGFARNLPVALQLVGKPFDEPTVLRAAYAYQQHARWYERRPPI
ncbi:MAG: Asp-tRNA(Asn)/Glu-tRNA(Gln) amidotransferase GatCAB subunit A [Deltaproteobacteria bacterium]|nr:MAG: Asp-tRNA(Asn)/Glu-tRNA(Gln) amidotransferase GatCAB subunit A [Deltaproteobacteria bacterium]